jgi:hypothetical protein
MHTNQLSSILLAGLYRGLGTRERALRVSACYQSHREYWRTRRYRRCGMGLISISFRIGLPPDQSLRRDREEAFSWLDTIESTRMTDRADDTVRTREDS